MYIYYRKKYIDLQTSNQEDILAFQDFLNPNFECHGYNRFFCTFAYWLLIFYFNVSMHGSILMRLFHIATLKSKIQLLWAILADVHTDRQTD